MGCFEEKGKATGYGAVNDYNKKGGGKKRPLWMRHFSVFKGK